jgi:hypothetical protein
MFLILNIIPYVAYEARDKVMLVKRIIRFGEQEGKNVTASSREKLL